MVFGSTPMWKADDGHYIALAGHDVDGDGLGGRQPGDIWYQPEISYKPNLSALLVPWAVVPVSFIRAVPELVIGSQARARNIATGQITNCIIADGGPDDKLGEGSICNATRMGLSGDPATGGTQEPIILWEFWPGRAAVVNGVAYTLQSFKH